jgi:hypothetical protein
MASNKFGISTLFAFYFFVCSVVGKIEGGSHRRKKNKPTVKFASHCFHMREAAGASRRSRKKERKRERDRKRQTTALILRTCR